MELMHENVNKIPSREVNILRKSTEPFIVGKKELLLLADPRVMHLRAEIQDLEEKLLKRGEAIKLLINMDINEKKSGVKTSVEFLHGRLKSYRAFKMKVKAEINAIEQKINDIKMGL